MKQILILLAIVCATNDCAKAQGRIYWSPLIGVNDATSSKALFFTDLGLEVFHAVYNLIEYDYADVSLNWIPSGYMSLKDNGHETYEVRDFHWRELFGNFYLGGKIGWEWSYTKLCPYISLRYRWQNFNTDFMDGNSAYNNKIRTLIPGVGIKMPFNNLRRLWGWAPVVELGSEYNIITKCKKGIFGTDKNQLNKKSISTSYGLGVWFYNFTMMGTLYMNNKDFYNREYTSDGGYYYPFANMKREEMYFELTLEYHINL